MRRKARDVADACGPTVQREDGEGLGRAILLDAYGENDCPTLTTKVTGCNGKKAGRYQRDQTAAIRTALAALDAASPLVPTFDAALAKLF